MEFKGTKGKWEVNHERSHKSETKVETETHRICEVKHYDGQISSKLKEPTQEEGKANALLISKAPEMLEALKYFVDRVENRTIKSTTTYNKYKQLIKEATEL